MGDRLATVDMGQKIGGRGCVRFEAAELDPNVTQCGLGRGITPYQVVS